MPRSVWLLVIGMFVNTVGNSFIWPLNTIYLHDHLGKSLSVAGLVLMANSAAGIVGNMLGGFLFDRIGGYRSVLAGILISLVALVGLVFYHGWPHYVWLLVLLGFGGGIVFPSMYAMVGTAWPEGGRKAFNSIYLANNAGVAIGPALAGLVASYNIEYIFVANTVMYVLFLLIAAVAYRGFKIDPATHTSVIKEKRTIREKAPLYSLTIMLSGFFLTWLVYSQWTTTLSTHALDIGISLGEYSLLWTINGALIVLGQPLIRPVIKRFEDRLKVQMLIGIIIFTSSFVVVGFAESFAMFVTSMVILTFGEMFVWPVIPTIANSLAPPGREGFYQGIVNSVSTGGRMIGPVVGGVLVDLYGTQVMLIILTAILSFAILTSLFYDVPLKREAAKQAAAHRP
ncbi:Multidrug resistance protein MdtH [Bhargavaea cecembensis DSE10]|uniref:Multidrug resistance protein MdtH n=1 Tax=Bhargavaea cecembensis DSE10 TaxID=1235279 RepID=M7P575_9BACL|nr:MFS transporter [Bhargavaea cecembensis]EMR05679.1 Multidrug resistance protein MdtH [Bhargavaea cecembensis DSE10]